MDFTAHPLRIGTITHAETDGGALRLTVDLGGNDHRTASANIREAYGPDDLTGRQVVVVLDPPGGAQGEVIVLAAVSPERGAVLLKPETPVPNGTAVV
ncbi:MAG: tRNA-binding protein [Bacteroidota bacterium]